MLDEGLMARPAPGCVSPSAIDIDTLSMFFDNELPPARHAGVAVHVAHCPRCARILGEFEALRSLLRSLGDHRPATD
jgi:anti-sigma factor RsiW